MTKLVKVLLIVFTFVISEIQAQEFQGIATYKTQRKLDIKLDSTKVGGMQDEIMAMLKKQFEKTYLLTFNKEESSYKEDESLAPPSVGRNAVMIMSMGGSGELYKNIKTQRYVKQSDLFGKTFLVQDSLKTLSWDLQSDTKNIGTYTCFKATLEREVVSDLDGSKEMQTVTAWYTPQIPVSQGPGDFWGLPGLILEVNTDKTTILCSKIIMNPKEKVEIEAPKKGTIVSRSEYTETVKKKMEEMRSMYGGRRNKRRN